MSIIGKTILEIPEKIGITKKNQVDNLGILVNKQNAGKELNAGVPT